MGGQHIVDAGEVAQGNKAEDAWEELCRKPIVVRDEAERDRDEDLNSVQVGVVFPQVDDSLGGSFLRPRICSSAVTTDSFLEAFFCTMENYRRKSYRPTVRVGSAERYMSLSLLSCG